VRVWESGREIKNTIAQTTPIFGFGGGDDS